MELSKAGRSLRTGNSLHLAVRDIIRDIGFIYDEEYGVPRTKFFLDFYLPEFHVGVEADGPVHKYNKRRDQDRDFIILAESGILVFRISQGDMTRREEVKANLTKFCDDAWVSRERRLNGS